jgi:hypothetical protein
VSRDYQYKAPTFDQLDKFGDVYRVLDRDSLLPDFAWMNRDMIRWFAAGWGVDLNLPYRELEHQVYEENARRSPCHGCGKSHRASVDPWRCDRCFMAHVVDQMRQRELRELNREIRLRRRREARLMASKLSVGRRQLVDLAGLDGPDEVFYEAFSEVA